MNKPFTYKDYAPFYFWKKAPFSQWCVDVDQFTEDGITFNCCEQYMMYHKAKLCGDIITGKQILNAKTPNVQKQLGRMVKNFNHIEWDTCKVDIVTRGNILKFEQNPAYKERLLAVYNNGQYFVEASPYDKIWGIGIDPTAAKAGAKWNGENLLGKALTGAAIYFILNP